MLSGYINSAQDVIDLINGCLFTKEGILELYSNGSFISLFVDKGKIKSFYSPKLENVEVKNKLSLLIYHMWEVLDEPQGFFTFREDKPEKEFIHLENPISADELVLQLQLITQELRNLLEKIITPFVVLKAKKPFAGMDKYNEKSLYEMINSPEGSLINVLREIEKLISEGFLDIYQFDQIGLEKEELSIDHLINDVEVNKINLSAILENLRISKFTGFLRGFDGLRQFELFYLKGKPVALYPVNYNIFELLITPDSDARISVVSMDEESLSIYMLRHSENKSINTLDGDFIDLGKVFVGMSRSRNTGLLTLHFPQKKLYLLYERGRLRGVLEDKERHLRVISGINVERPFYIDLTIQEAMGNMAAVMYLFLINLVYGVLLKHASYLVKSVMSYMASSDLFAYEEGNIKYRRRPKGEDEVILAFLLNLLDMGYKTLGEERLKDALEFSLHPYKDIFKIMDVEEFIKLPNESASS